ncbi:MAG: hypothetical protein HC930_00055 [Hydrococcus sp. SU_1_0]|nr:hypothetical protein [Hydrococcus sp. SU_1_0]
MKKIYLMITDAGGGHTSSARALQAAIEKQQLPWKIYVVNFYQEIIGTDIEENFYNNLILKQDWTRIYWPIIVPLFRLKILLSRFTWLARLKNYWHENKPDLVISLMPFVNGYMCESLHSIWPNVPFITVVGDFVSNFPGYWFENDKQFIICHTEEAIQKSLKVGIRKERIFCTSGRIINPRFYESINCNRRVERQKLGLDPDLITGLVSFGSRGSMAIMEIYKRLQQSSLDIQLILFVEK